jgi:hypothetical protein
MLCLQELCEYSARGRSFAQLFCLPVVHAQRYCSTQAFICSVCPSVREWKAVERFCWIPKLAQSDLEKCDVKRGSRSDMILLERPNQGTRCFRYSSATPGPSIVLFSAFRSSPVRFFGSFSNNRDQDRSTFD